MTKIESSRRSADEEVAYFAGVIDMSQAAEKYLAEAGDESRLRAEALGLMAKAIAPARLPIHVEAEAFDLSCFMRSPGALAEADAAETCLAAADRRSIESRIEDELEADRADLPGELPILALMTMLGELAQGISDEEVDAAEDAAIALAGLARRTAFDLRRVFAEAGL